MNFSDFERTLQKIIPAEFLKSNIDLKKSAKMPEDEIVKRAESLYGNQPKYYSQKVGKYISIKSINGKLVWSVRFAPVDEDGFLGKSGHTIFEFDDETGEVIKKSFSPY